MSTKILYGLQVALSRLKRQDPVFLSPHFMEGDIWFQPWKGLKILICLTQVHRPLASGSAGKESFIHDAVRATTAWRQGLNLHC